MISLVSAGSPYDSYTKQSYIINQEEIDPEFNVTFWEEGEYLRYNIDRLNLPKQYAHAICIEENTDVLLERNPNQFQPDYWLKKNDGTAWSFRKLEMENWCDNTDGFGYANTNIQKAESRWRLSNLKDIILKIFVGRGTSKFEIEDSGLNVYSDDEGDELFIENKNETLEIKLDVGSPLFRMDLE